MDTVYIVWERLSPDLKTMFTPGSLDPIIVGVYTDEMAALREGGKQGRWMTPHPVVPALPR